MKIVKFTNGKYGVQDGDKFLYGFSTHCSWHKPSLGDECLFFDTIKDAEDALYRLNHPTQPFNVALVVKDIDNEDD